METHAHAGMLLPHPGNSPRAIEDVIALGSDVDSSGAVPVDWLNRPLEWPHSVPWIRRLVERLARQFLLVGSPVRQKPLSLFWPGLIPRHLFFLAMVRAHGFRRLLPPY